MTAPHLIGQFVCPVRLRQKRTRRAIAVCLLVALLGPFVALAQPPTVPVQPYSEVEQLKIQNINLEGAIVRRAVEDWQLKVARLKAELEMRRPGFAWNPETGAWTKTDVTNPK